MPIFADFLVSLPAGTVIFMSVLLFGTLLRRLAFFAPWMDLLPLIAFAALVGALLRLIRPSRASLTALFAGLVTSALLGYLRLNARPGDAFNPLVFGAPGMILTLLAVLSGARLRLLRKSAP
ncbi:MAG: hypothetical protein Fur0035_13540 [Anaerolineales bacterium]